MFQLKVFIRRLLVFAGTVSILMVVIAFTRLPYDMQIWLATKNNNLKILPQYIIFMGGSGMPSGENLVRLYYTSVAATEFREASVIIIHPLDLDVKQQMLNELILRGIDSNRIVFETQGTNTRGQVLNLKQMHQLLDAKILVVTSPEYMYRTLSCFRKEGFSNVGGLPAFENAMFVDLNYDFKKAGGKSYAPDVSSSLALRYNFWNYLKLEITCIREFFAIGYYKLNGWI